MQEALTASGHRVGHTHRIRSDKGKKHKPSANPAVQGHPRGNGTVPSDNEGENSQSGGR